MITTAGKLAYRIEPIRLTIRTGWTTTIEVTHYRLLKRRSDELDWHELMVYRTRAAALAQLTRRAPNWRDYVGH